MRAERVVRITGEGLTVEDVAHVASGARACLDEGARERMEAGRQVVNRAVEEGRPVYGVTTGFGRLAQVTISRSDLARLQENLLASHAVGVGDPLSPEAVRGAMLLRANTLAKGHSGARPAVVDLLIGMLNRDVVPIVPSKGSLGASGDLAPLAHLSLVLTGKGEAWHQGRRMPGGEALALAGLQPLALEPKEGLALINGTQVMTALAALLCHRARRLSLLADITGAMTLEALRGIPSAFDPRVHQLRPHPGQMATARNLLGLLEGSQLTTRCGEVRVQDPYSLRCIPQVHGASKDALAYARRVVEVEVNSVTDNPLVFPGEEEVISGGNFHGQPVALAMDFLGIALAELGSISERRIEQMLNPALSGLPAFLAPESGLNSGFMIAQYTAAALVSENKVLAGPASIDSIPTSANQEDHVSMGTIAARKAWEIAGNLEAVLAIEALAACQAMDMRRPLAPGVGTREARRILREAVPFMEKDQELHRDIETVRVMVATGSLLAAVEAAVDLGCGRDEE